MTTSFPKKTGSYCLNYWPGGDKDGKDKDIKNLKDKSLDECKTKCAGNDKCGAYQYNSTLKTCYLGTSLYDSPACPGRDSYIYSQKQCDNNSMCAHTDCPTSDDASHCCCDTGTNLCRAQKDSCPTCPHGQTTYPWIWHSYDYDKCDKKKPCAVYDKDLFQYCLDEKTAYDIDSNDFCDLTDCGEGYLTSCASWPFPGKSHLFRYYGNNEPYVCTYPGQNCAHKPSDTNLIFYDENYPGPVSAKARGSGC